MTPDHVNPERPWPALDALRAATERSGRTLAPRLTVYPEYVRAEDEWLHPDVRTAVRHASDLEGLARDDAWASGGDTDAADPPRRRPARRRPDAWWSSAPRRAGAWPRCSTACGPARPSTRPRSSRCSARAVRRSATVADGGRPAPARLVGDDVTFVRNRNINYTNICTFKCRFCAFSKGPLSLNLRGDPYLLDLAEMQRRVVEAVDCGATEVCLQGGIHPDFDGDYYLDVARAVKEVAPDIHVHGFTALEVTEGAKRLDMDLAEYLLLAKEAGLATLPGTAAEILDDEVRAVICPDKITTEEWLHAHRTAHEVGLRSNVTIMFGSVERPEHVARHLLRTRALQLETGGFTEFVPLPFVHMATPIYLTGRARRGPTFREVLLMHAVGRIAYAGAIDNIQISWVKTGVGGARQALQAGCNDLGGTLMDENISRAAGASHGQEADDVMFGAIVEPLGRPLVQRTTLYGRTTTVGRRLRPVDDDGLAAAAAHGTGAGRRPRASSAPGSPWRSEPIGEAQVRRRRTRTVAPSRPAPGHGREGSQMTDAPTTDVVAIGNALVDVLAERRRRRAGDARHGQGVDGPHRHRAGRDRLRRDGARASRRRAGARRTRSSASRRSAAAARTSAGSATTSSARSTSTTSAPPAWRSTCRPRPTGSAPGSAWCS